MPGMPGRRIETVRAAALLLERVVRRLEPDRVVFSAFGLREGRAVRALLGRRSWPRTRCSPGPRISAARRSRLPEIGAAMGDWTAARSRRRNDPSSGALRLAVCEVSDSAWREHPAFRAREAFYRLAQYPFIGLDHAERAFLAYAVFIRYEGSPDDLFIRPMLLAAAGARAAPRRAPGRRAAAGLPDLGRRARTAADQPARGSRATSCGCTCPRRTRRPTRRS